MRLNKGFTLVELMIVVAILGVLAAIAVPAYIGYVSSSKRAEAKANLETIRLLEEQYYADHKQYVEAADTATLMANLPGFQPGNPDDLYYTYSVEFKGGDNQTFKATASPKANAPAGDLTIDESNNKTGPW